MRIDQAVYEHLKANAPVAALVVDRIYPMTGDQRTGVPYIVFEVISNQVDEGMRGSHELAHPRFESG